MSAPRGMCQSPAPSPPAHGHTLHLCVIQSHPAQEKQNSQHRWSHCWNDQIRKFKMAFQNYTQWCKGKYACSKWKDRTFQQRNKPWKKTPKPKTLNWRLNYLQYKIHLMGLTVKETTEDVTQLEHRPVELSAAQWSKTQEKRKLGSLY